MADEGQNGEARRDYATGLRSGILDPKHYEAIGIALWTFVWCVDRQTPSGWVHGGDIVTYAQIAQEVGLPTADAARYQIRRLVAGGYVRVEAEQGKHGMRIRVTTPKKSYHTPPASQRRRVQKPKSAPPHNNPDTSGVPAPQPSGVPAPHLRRPSAAHYKEETQGRLRDSEHPLPPAMAPEDLYALASRYGLRLDVMNGAFTAGQNGHLFVDVLRLGSTTLDSALAAIAKREKRYQPGSAHAWIDALLAEAAKPAAKKCSVTSDDKWAQVEAQGWDYKP